METANLVPAGRAVSAAGSGPFFDQDAALHPLHIYEVRRVGLAIDGWGWRGAGGLELVSAY